METDRGILSNHLSELYRIAVKFKDTALLADQELKWEFKDQFRYVEDYLTLLNLSQTNQPEFEKTDKNVMAIGYYFLINRIREMENRIAAYCFGKTAYIIDDFPLYSIMINQSGSTFMPGEKIQISAGIGAYSRPAQAIVTINKQRIQVGEMGYASFTQSTPGKPGNYHLPVQIEYYDENGKKNLKVYEVQYTVRDTCPK